MTIQLHCCRFTWLKVDSHSCHRVRKALDEQGIEYEVTKGPLRDRSRVEEVSGQSRYPVIEFEDGRAYRDESMDMAAKIRAGKLFAS